MGSIFGKESVEEPSFDVLLRRKNTKTPYELRKYGERFAVSVTYTNRGNDNSSPFRTLAGYIGVFGTPQNEGSKSIAMTAPVVMEQDDDFKKPESIAMTAPVVMENNVDGDMKKMMFMLPSEYNYISKIPKPTNPAVHIDEIPSEVGAVYRYNGSFNDKINRDMAKALGDQLMNDGVKGINEKFVIENFQAWGYNPPYTLPYFRRNEVWVKLNDNQVNYLKEKYPSIGGGSLVGGSPSSNKGRNMLTLSLCGLVVGALAVGFLSRPRTQYRRL